MLPVDSRQPTLSRPPAGDLALHAEPSEASAFAVVEAFIGLAIVDVLLNLFGYTSVRRLLSRCARRSNVATDVGHDTPATVSAALGRAAVYYPRQAMCLQRSATLVWLLRRRGMSLHLIIGCQHTPFHAHAWVELDDGTVLNDRASVKTQYAEMERT